MIIFSINLESAGSNTTTNNSTSRASSSSPNSVGQSMSPPSISNGINHQQQQQSNSTNNSVDLRAFKLQNFVIKSRLNFTELSLLKENIGRLFEQFLNQVLAKCVTLGTTPAYSAYPPYYRCVVNRVCYLKKPSNCKTIRVETIKSSTDCLRAIVEYSRVNESTRELPYVFLTTHSSVYVSSSSSS